MPKKNPTRTPPASFTFYPAKPRNNLTGKRFQRLLVVRFLGKTRKATERRIRWRYYWECLCDCRNILITDGSSLTVGNTTSCGCAHVDAITRHGLFSTTEYQIWAGMKQRCLNPLDANYKNYGARGIKVCQRWLDSFENFIADVGKRPVGYSLDRIDNNGPYAPENCRWATPKQQAENRRKHQTYVHPNTRFITFNNQTKTITQWARSVGLGSGRALVNRIDRGWPLEKALTELAVPKTATRNKRL